MDMSFSGRVKHEIAQITVQRPCCATASSYGAACFSRYFGARGLHLVTEHKAVAQWVWRQFTDAGVRGSVRARGGHAANYEFMVDGAYEVEKMLVLFSHTGEETALRINEENLLCDDCFARFVAAAFMCAGVAPNPEKGYTLEFVSPRFLLMNDLMCLLRARGYTPGRAKRKGNHVLYLKNSGQVEDLLTTMGASKSALDIMNLKIYKDFRNKANRATNCETANIGKTVTANRIILEAIAFLQAHDAFETLPARMREAARLRLENPEASLSELLPLCGEPVSKSGLSNRYRSIRRRAIVLKERLNAQPEQENQHAKR